MQLNKLNRFNRLDRKKLSVDKEFEKVYHRCINEVNRRNTSCGRMNEYLNALLTIMKNNKE